jgi:soluble P-type ATPase
VKSGGEDRAKAAYVRRLMPDRVACIGNGRNDRRMLRLAALGIAVVQAEGASTEALAAADLLVPSVSDALDLFLNPRRLTASLRA